MWNCASVEVLNSVWCALMVGRLCGISVPFACAALCVDRWFDVIVSLLDGIAEVLGKAVRIGGDVMEWREAVR